MLRSADALKGFTIQATDGNIGHVKDIYFDDEGWAVRYLVVDTGNWLMGRKVLITPMFIDKPDWDNKLLKLSITTKQVRDSPDIDTEKPVSRQHEHDYLGYYGYPIYWGGRGMWGAGIYPGAMIPGHPDHVEAHSTDSEPVRTGSEKYGSDRNHKDDSHLRSAKAVTGYHIEASDGEIGHLSDMLVDDETWAIRYLIVDTSNWWLGHKVLISPLWIETLHWVESLIKVNLSREAIQKSAPYEDAFAVDRHREIELHQNYDRVGYWEREENDEEFDA
jgi:hypothetical protein